MEVIWDPVPIYIHYTQDQVSIAAFEDGCFPLWDPTRGLGVPHLIITGASFDFPLKILAYLMNSEAGWELYLLLRFFLAGIFCFLLARELGLNFSGALLSGLSFMLCGYFREYHNFQNLNIEVLFPLLLLFMAKTIKRPRIITVIGAIFVLSLFDNHPESAAYACAYATVFYVVIGALHLRKTKGTARDVAGLVLIYLTIMVGGTLLISDSLLGYAEVLDRSWHFHANWLGQLRFPVSSSIGMVTPLFDYWMPSQPNLALEHLEQFKLVPAYLGIVTLALACLALIRPKNIPASGLFFSGMALVLTGVIFGVVPFNLLLHLPLARSFQNFRYAQPFLAHCVAMLAGMGLEMVIRDRKRRFEALVIGGLFAAWVAGHLFIFRHQILHSPHAVYWMTWGVAAAAAIVLTALAIRLYRPQAKSRILAAAIIIGAGVELALYFNFMVPLYGPRAFNAGSTPAVNFIKKKEGGLFRIWGMDPWILHPNLAGLYGLSDLRDQNPTYPLEYADLLSKVNGWKDETEIISNFLAGGKFYFDLEWNKVPPRLLDVLNVRYVLSYRDPGTKPWEADPADIEIKAPANNYVVKDFIGVGGKKRDGIIAHAPARIKMNNAKAAGAAPGFLSLDAGILPGAARCKETDGVNLAVLVETGHKNKLAFARTFNVERDASWIPVGIDLGEGARAIILASMPGPGDDRRCDYGAWSWPVVSSPENKARPGLKKIYDRELMVFENEDALPRVFGVSEIPRAKDVAGFLERIKDAPDGPRDLSASSEPGPADVVVTDIDEGYGRLSFKTLAHGPGFVVISNHYFSGWRARINGAETKIHRVDGLLQGVVVPPGEGEVVLTYEPVSFRVGMWYHIFGLLSLIAVLVASRAGRGRNVKIKPDGGQIS